MYNTDKVIMGAPSEVFVDGVNVGWTKGGVRLRTTKSYWYRNSLSGLGAEGAVKEDESFYISTVMVENLLDSVKKAWGINESIDYSTPEQSKLQFGGSTTIPIHVVRFSGPGRRVVFYKAAAIDFGEIQYTETEVLTPITFRVLLDTSKFVGNMVGYFLDGITDIYSNLTCRVTVFYTSGSKDLVCRTTVIYALNSKDLVCRVTVVYIPGTSNLVSRVVILRESSSSLVSRLITLKETSSNLVSRVTVAYAPGTLNLVSRVTVLKESSDNLVSRATVLKETGSDLVSRTTVTQGWLTSNLVCRVTITSP